MSSKNYKFTFVPAEVPRPEFAEYIEAFRAAWIEASKHPTRTFHIAVVDGDRCAKIHSVSFAELPVPFTVAGSLRWRLQQPVRSPSRQKLRELLAGADPASTTSRTAPRRPMLGSRPDAEDTLEE